MCIVYLFKLNDIQPNNMKKFCGINNLSFIKSAMTWNKIHLEANKQRHYNKLSCTEKYSHYPFFKRMPAVPFTLKKYSFAYCPRHY
jgi:hypothetical protein